MAKMDWDKARRRELPTERRKSTSASGQCRGTVSPKQQRYMRHLAAKYGTTFTDMNSCCSMHASEWITQVKATRQRL